MANERARRKKLEQKRRKREEKRRALRAEAGSATWAPPLMSLTLREFAEPLLERLPGEENPDDWKLVLSWVAMVWNVDDEVSERTIALGQEVFESFGWQEDVAEEVRRLRARKKELFHCDPRRVVGVEVEDLGDTMYVTALSVIA